MALALHPLEQIVNVHWDEFRLVSVLVGQFTENTPLYTIRFEIPVAWHSYNDTGTTPQYNGDVSIPCVIIPGGTTGGITGPVEITGPQANPPTVFIDYRGYVTVTGGPPSTETRYFDYNGKKIDAIPAAPVRPLGFAIASDDAGTVYYKDGNLKKYDKDGIKIWDANISADTVHFDSSTQLIQASFASSGAPDYVPFLTVGETQWFDLNGAIVRSVTINDAQTSSSVVVSRNGKFYAFLQETDTNYHAIKAWDQEGHVLYELPGEPKNGTLNLGMIPYAEDYLLVNTQKTYPQQQSPPLSNPFTVTQKKDIGLRIVNKFGAVVFNTVYTSPIAKQIFTVFPDGSSQIDTSGSTYGELRIIKVSLYWP